MFLLWIIRFAELVQNRSFREFNTKRCTVTLPDQRSSENSDLLRSRFASFFFFCFFFLYIYHTDRRGRRPVMSVLLLRGQGRRSRTCNYLYGQSEAPPGSLTNDLERPRRLCRIVGALMGFRWNCAIPLNEHSCETPLHGRRRPVRTNFGPIDPDVNANENDRRTECVVRDPIADWTRLLLRVTCTSLSVSGSKRDG